GAPGRARLRPVDDHAVPIKASQMDLRCGDEDAGAGLVAWLVRRVIAAFVIVAWGDQDPVTWTGGIDGSLNRLEVEPGVVPPRKLPPAVVLRDQQNTRRGRSSPNQGQCRNRNQGKQEASASGSSYVAKRRWLSHPTTSPKGNPQMLLPQAQILSPSPRRRQVNASRRRCSSGPREGPRCRGARSRARPLGSAPRRRRAPTAGARPARRPSAGRGGCPCA